MMRNSLTSETNYRDLFDAVPVAIWVKDFSRPYAALERLKAQEVTDIRAYLKTNPAFLYELFGMVDILHVNAAALNLVGAANKEELLAGLQRVFIPEMMKIFEEQVVTLWQGGTCLEDETLLSTLQGKRFPVTVTLTVIGDRPDYSRVLVTFTAITERKQVDDETKRLKAFYEDVLDNLSLQIAIFDPEGHFLYVNPAGLSDPEVRRWVLGKTEADFMRKTGRPASLAETRLAYLHRAVSERQLVIFEERFPARSGKTKIFMHSYSPIFDQDGDVSKVVGYRYDITEHKQAEEEIRRLNEDLEQRVIERTAQLETANRELEAFSYSVSHDLRAPLRAIDGFAEMLAEDYAETLPPPAKEHLQVIQRSAQEMDQLINDLLAFARLGRQALHRQEVDVTALVRDVIEAMPYENGQGCAEIIIGTLPPCQADPALLRQVLTNILSNAFKFAREKEVARIEVGSLQHEGKTVYFVKDNGVGFDMAYADKLFGVFERLHLSEEYEGTGVGLALVQRIIRRHGGKVWAEAALDEGATFYFTLERA